MGTLIAFRAAGRLKVIVAMPVSSSNSVVTNESDMVDVSLIVVGHGFIICSAPFGV